MIHTFFFEIKLFSQEYINVITIYFFHPQESETDVDEILDSLICMFINITNK
jgi:hypothetical protein